MDRGLPLLGGVVDGGNEDLVTAEAVEDEVGSAADEQFAEIGLGGGVAEVGVKLESFNESHDARGETFGSVGIVEGDVSTNLAQTGNGEGRPDNLGRAFHRCEGRASSGSGSSRICHALMSRLRSRGAQNQEAYDLSS